LIDQLKKYQLYIDDSGSRHPNHEPNIQRTDTLDWFALGGVLIDVDDLKPAIAFHKAFVEKWKIVTPLHSTKIRGKRKEFSWLGTDTKKADVFYQELNDMLLAQPVLGFACVIDRPGYNSRYAEKHGQDRWLMCKTAYCILLERAAKFVHSQNGIMEVFFEEAGRTEDRNLQNYHRLLKLEGMPFDKGNSSQYGGLSKDDFNKIVLGDAQRLTKDSPLIQLADMYLYPIVKGGYDKDYQPYRDLMRANRIVDAIIDNDMRSTNGIKYSCFDLVKNKGPA
jgi:Protein of unknown function (DUF3800)